MYYYTRCVCWFCIVSRRFRLMFAEVSASKQEYDIINIAVPTTTVQISITLASFFVLVMVPLYKFPTNHAVMWNWLVIYLPSWKVWKSVGAIIPNIFKNKIVFQTTNQVIMFDSLVANGSLLGIVDLCSPRTSTADDWVRDHHHG